MGELSPVIEGHAKYREGKKVSTGFLEFKIKLKWRYCFNLKNKMVFKEDQWQTLFQNTENKYKHVKALLKGISP